MRGWILQQVVKLAAIAASEDDVVLLVDSDIEFIRPFTAEMFVRNGMVRFFSKPDQIDKRLSRHMTWHRVARALLGLPPAEPPYAGLHLVASCLGPDDRQADVGAGRRPRRGARGPPRSLGSSTSRVRRSMACSSMA